MANNLVAFGADNVYVIVNPPQPVIASGGQTRNAGCVGGGSWGPLNVPLACGTPAQALSQFGLPIAGNPAPLVTEVSLFLQQIPAGVAYATRIDDGTSAAAAYIWDDAVPTPIMTFTGKYNGTTGNAISVQSGAGSQASTVKISIFPPNAPPEIYDNLPTGVPGMTAAVNAINNGIAGGQPASQWVVATIGASLTGLTTTLANHSLTAGLDGLSGIVPTDLLGVDGSAGSRTGMYALRTFPFQYLWLCGMTIDTAWPTMLTFAKSEDALAIGSFPENETPTAAIALKLAAGINDPMMALVMNHLVVNDTILNAVVYIAPACAFAGTCCSINPWQSPGNKTVNGIIGTDKTYGSSPQPFSAADDANLESNGITYVSNPIPAGNVFGWRNGKNSNSNNFATSECAYSTLTNMIVNDLQGPTLGQFINQIQGTKADDPLREAVRGALNSYFGRGKGTQWDDFSVVCDLTNNPPNSIKQGLLIATVLVAYFAVVNKFIINLTAGQTVSVTPSLAQ